MAPTGTDPVPQGFHSCALPIALESLMRGFHSLPHVCLDPFLEVHPHYVCHMVATPLLIIQTWTSRCYPARVAPQGLEPCPPVLQTGVTTIYTKEPYAMFLHEGPWLPLPRICRLLR